MPCVNLQGGQYGQLFVAQQQVEEIYIYIPGTQMTPVLIGKGLVLEGWNPKIEDKQVPGIYHKPFQQSQVQKFQIFRSFDLCPLWSTLTFCGHHWVFSWDERLTVENGIVWVAYSNYFQTYLENVPRNFLKLIILKIIVWVAPKDVPRNKTFCRFMISLSPCFVSCLQSQTKTLIQIHCCLTVKLFALLVGHGLAFVKLSGAWPVLAWIVES